MFESKEEITSDLCLPNNVNIDSYADDIDHSISPTVSSSENEAHEEFSVDLDVICMLINTKSGSREGKHLVKALQHCNKFEIVMFDLMELIHNEQEHGIECAYKDLVEFLNSHQDLQLRIVAAGGDGTIKLVFEILYKKLNLQKIPPIAILPIGTGNELSHCLGWGKGADITALEEFLQNVTTGQTSYMDWWNITITTENPDGTETIEERSMCCFFSIGFMAKITHRFHTKRETDLNACQSRFENKLWHVYYAVDDMFSFTPKFLKSMVELEIDDEIVNIADDMQSLQFFNIHSSADGLDFWIAEQDSFESDLIASEDLQQPFFNDQLLEVCTTRDVFHLTGIKWQFTHAQRLAQAKKMKFRTFQPIDAQIDGEPWLLPPSTVTITRKNEVKVVIGPGETRM